MMWESAILVQGFGANMAITLTNSIIKSFESQSETEYPYESCGFIIGDYISSSKSIGSVYLPAKNIKHINAERRFLIDPKAYEQAESEAEKLGLSIISIVHSHPDHPDKPSEFDLNHAWPGFSYIIISVQKGNAVSFKSWKLNDDRTSFLEEDVVNKGEDNE